MTRTKKTLKFTVAEKTEKNLPKNVECELIDEKIENKPKIEAQNVVNKAKIVPIESIVMRKNPEKLIQLDP